MFLPMKRFYLNPDSFFISLSWVSTDFFASSRPFLLFFVLSFGKYGFWQKNYASTDSNCNNRVYESVFFRYIPISPVFLLIYCSKSTVSGKKYALRPYAEIQFLSFSCCRITSLSLLQDFPPVFYFPISSARISSSSFLIASTGAFCPVQSSICAAP